MASSSSPGAVSGMRRDNSSAGGAKYFNVSQSSTTTTDDEQFNSRSDGDTKNLKNKMSNTDDEFNRRSDEEKRLKRKMSNKNSARKSRQKKQDYMDKLRQEIEETTELNAQMKRELIAESQSHSNTTECNNTLLSEAVRLCSTLEAIAQLKPPGAQLWPVEAETPSFESLLARYRNMVGNCRAIQDRLLNTPGSYQEFLP